jgi:hypothetical protein
LRILPDVRLFRYRRKDESFAPASVCIEVGVTCPGSSDHL